MWGPVLVRGTGVVVVMAGGTMGLLGTLKPRTEGPGGPVLVATAWMVGTKCVVRHEGGEVRWGSVGLGWGRSEYGGSVTG